jgi:hypothetical protein
MKTSLLLVLGLLLGNSCSWSAEAGVEVGRVHYENADVSGILPQYAAMVGLKLVVDSRVTRTGHLVTLVANVRVTGEAAKLVEKALLDQAGIVITRLDDKRASVTYNDALPITSAKRAPGKSKSSN